MLQEVVLSQLLRARSLSEARRGSARLALVDRWMWSRLSALLLPILLVVACSTEDKSFSVVENTAPSISASASTTIVIKQPESSSTTTTLAPSFAGQIAHAAGDVLVYPAPDAPIHSRVVPATTILGSPTVLPVVEGPVAGWIEVSLPGRPNEATGWVEADQFTFAATDQRIEVDLAAATLTFFVDDEPALSTEVAIGSPDNPTPPGSFFVTDIVKLTDPSGPWGPFAIGLSARSDTITEFNGGDGIIGIHGTNRPDRIGEPVSLGCVRLPNETIAKLASQVQLGIPVLIK